MKNSLKLGLKKVRWEAMKEKIMKKNPNSQLKIRPKSKTIEQLTLPIQIISLKCPILKSQNVKTPVTFEKCDHLEFFDADNFQKSRISKCPICGTKGTYDDLVLIEFFVDILKNNTSSDKIKINAEGNVLPANEMSVNQIAAIKSEPISSQEKLSNGFSPNGSVPSSSNHNLDNPIRGSLMPERNKSLNGPRAARRGKTVSEEEAERQEIINNEIRLKNAENQNEKLKQKISLMERFIGSILYQKENQNLIKQKIKENKGTFII